MANEYKEMKMCAIGPNEEVQIYKRKYTELFCNRKKIK